MQNDPIEILALTIDTFCRAYGIGRTKVYEEISQGRLLTKKVGRRTLIMKVDAEAWATGLPSGGGLMPRIGEGEDYPAADIEVGQSAICEDHLDAPRKHGQHIAQTGSRCPKCGGRSPKNMQTQRPWCRRCGPFPTLPKDNDHGNK